MDTKMDKSTFENFAAAVLDSYGRVVSRKEFIEFKEKEFFEFKQTVERRFDKIDERFEGVDGQFKSIDKRFKGIEATLEDVKEQLSQVVTKKDFIEYIGAIFGKIEEINKKL
jgi:archaellum component FlaC